ncbi:type VI secretion system baseplate subunit TssK [Vibrio sp. JC009]|uniref:type VI secretion system baseplate subunit TssK n=1 Tax=Vibrio sp. JC009 TaxID=2912314 RepID=UPI0023B19B14|nr:type VI secretion system baseplate subunit TssK [Vibrio sp. JC009]WED22940.1 type VI secretion system baseplate subunit TssK [Vibrio sp. JC009]
MSWRNKVIWTEGMFLRPQHFQQHDRHLEQLLESRCAPMRPYSWGISELSITQDLLAQEKLAIESCSGILPDGTPFNIGGEDQPPKVLTVPDNTRDTIVYLCLPARRKGQIEADANEKPQILARYLPREQDVSDSNHGSNSEAAILTGELCLHLMLEPEDRSAFVEMPLCRIIEKKADKTVVLDKDFIPPCLDCSAVPKVHGYLVELQGMLKHRAEAIAGRVTESGRGGAAEIADFMMLQAVNRLEPLFTHLTLARGVHPEEFFRIGIQMAGELATFARRNKRPEAMPEYLHNDLKTTFDGLMSSLRQSLSMVLEQNAIPVEIQARKYGIYVAVLGDHTLLGSANFVLAVNAQVSAETLRSHFPTQVKIGPVEQIRQLVNLQLPGIAIRPLPVAPRQIPYHAGFNYFELDRNSELWKQLSTSGGFAFHAGGDFPGLELEFWAIKGE